MLQTPTSLSLTGEVTSILSTTRLGEVTKMLSIPILMTMIPNMLKQPIDDRLDVLLDHQIVDMKLILNMNRFFRNHVQNESEAVVACAGGEPNHLMEAVSSIDSDKVETGHAT
ncbi:hypothetical protein HUG17_2765 [Dermatophagoides farinae]|uniref:Uncharacterized protein n=1 Tax=Dermatophagoides farinae TaxID=6954 RepID=A0A9D4NV72_DERFA|nr:hypothetical protein HUG17_2765 [Dermatophagoides farinae]